MDRYIDDIPLDLARAAHAGTSFDPEARATTEREGYAALLSHDFEALSEHATTDEKRATLDAEFARYREGYRGHVVGVLHAKSRCMSTMITGGSNFPLRRQQKLGGFADKRVTAMIEFRERALKAIRKALCPEDRPILSGDSDAVVRLRSEIDKSEKLRDRMKELNATIRKHAKAGVDAQAAALVAAGLSEGAARGLLAPDFAGRIGFADFELTNLGANIRRMKARLGALAVTKATPDAEVRGESGITLEDAPADNRVRLYFPGKPDISVRSALKASGFRWSPSIGAWSAYRNHNSLAHARSLVGEPTVKEGAA